MRVGVLDLLVPFPSRGRHEAFMRWLLRRQGAGIVPQAVSVWCRRLGHDVHYAVYHGQGRPERLLPEKIDVLFVACHSPASALAYAMARLFRDRGTVTVLGGCHASSFPQDSLRFFDIVVDRCDEALVRSILEDPRGLRGWVTSPRPLGEIPTVEERLPEIRASAFLAGRRWFGVTVPLLASAGCPNACDFCVDSRRPWQEFSLEQLEEDLRFVADRLPGVRLAFLDPNFAVRFDPVMSVLERVPPPRRSPYVMQCSLGFLDDERLRRLRATGCVYVAPSVESWVGYSAKAGAGHHRGRRKLGRIAARLERVREYVPGIQVNFVFGLDADDGREHLRLTLELARRLPFVLPTATVAMPYGGTPMYERYLAEGRILRSLPFLFYYLPHLATTLVRETPASFYDRLIAFIGSTTSVRSTMRRFGSGIPAEQGVLHSFRALEARRTVRELRRIRSLLESDREFRAFHEGRTTRLPRYYVERFEGLLGPYAGLLNERERTPSHGDPESAAAVCI